MKNFSFSKLRYLLRVGGLVAILLLWSVPAAAQDFVDPASIEKLINQYIAGFGPSGTMTITSLTIFPNPAETEEIVTAAADLSDPTVASSANFTWYVNGVMRKDISGIAQSSTAFVAPSTPGVLHIKVVMETASASSTAERTVMLETSALQKFYSQFQSQADELVFQLEQIKSEKTLRIEQSPERPQPGDKVTFYAQSFQFDVGDADITWTVNGKVVKSGKGANTFSMTAGPAGSVSDVGVQVNSAAGQAVRSIPIIPIAISFYWWTDTYVPMWYQGKALPSPGARIFVEAVPSLPENIRSALTYSWFVDDALIREASGPGKSIFAYSIPAAAILQNPIRVRVTNIAGTINAEAGFSLPTHAPEALVYEIKPLAGVDSSSVLRSAKRAAGRVIEMLVEPFFVPRQALTSLRYQWNLNGKDIDTTNDPKPRYFTLTSTPENTGAQSFSVSFEDLVRKAARAGHTFNVILE